MPTFKCKMCGGALEIENNASIATCEYCGTTQTLPKIDDEKRANLYDRANHFRRNNEFDKAMGIYEQILNEDNTDAEAYWSLVLCRYGIEYVEDPATHKRVPTVNRAQFTSIFDDDNYKSALQYADGYQKSIYEQEANTINEIQKGILAISQKEEPFDVFICYKETDNQGRRTPDSVLANDLYHQLTNEGFKVFFAAITLEDKLGTAYEPYIFAALNSAKVMVVLGTKPEYFNAVWVKNEWSRYLALVKNSGGKKMLIPAYKDMDPYDLPEEFSHLQAQDMSKLGFMQDLIRGIKKLTEAQTANKTVIKETVISGGNANTAPLLKRAFMFLEDGDWSSADEYCEKVLDIDPECAEAYLGKLLSELKLNTTADLQNLETPFDNYTNYQKAVRFGSNDLKTELQDYIDTINAQNREKELKQKYDYAKNAMRYVTSEDAYLSAARKFDEISDYLDSAELAEECRRRAGLTHYKAIEAIYKAACNMEKRETTDMSLRVSDLKTALSKFEEIPDYKDSSEKAIEIKNKIEELNAKINAKIEARKKLRKKIIAITVPSLCAVIAFVILLNTAIIPNIKYRKAVALIDEGNIVEAYDSLISLDGYKDSVDKANIIYAKYCTEKIKSANVGDCVPFGVYEQDNNLDNGAENIEWLVLDKQDNRYLLISKYALDCKPYNENYVDVTWETCTLRQWLNNDFLNTAFTEEEKAMIPTVTVIADKNPSYNTNPGNDTQDKVFLLSINEANKYFDSYDDRKCQPTDYAVANNAYEAADGNCWWWLRSPGSNQSGAAGVHFFGVIYESGNFVRSDIGAVRPALWINLNT